MKKEEYQKAVNQAEKILRRRMDNGFLNNRKINKNLLLNFIKDSTFYLIKNTELTNERAVQEARKNLFVRLEQSDITQFKKIEDYISEQDIFRKSSLYNVGQVLSVGKVENVEYTYCDKTWVYKIEGVDDLIDENDLYNLVERAEETKTKKKKEDKDGETIGELRKGKNEKTEKDIWNVSLSTKLSREEWLKIASRAKENNGYYYKKGGFFSFNTEDDAMRFNNIDYVEHKEDKEEKEEFKEVKKIEANKNNVTIKEKPQQLTLDFFSHTQEKKEAQKKNEKTTKKEDYEKDSKRNTGVSGGGNPGNTSLRTEPNSNRSRGNNQESGGDRNGVSVGVNIGNDDRGDSGELSDDGRDSGGETVRTVDGRAEGDDNRVRQGDSGERAAVSEGSGRVETTGNTITEGVGRGFQTDGRDKGGDIQSGGREDTTTRQADGPGSGESVHSSREGSIGDIQRTDQGTTKEIHGITESRRDDGSGRVPKEIEDDNRRDGRDREGVRNAGGEGAEGAEGARDESDKGEDGRDRYEDRKPEEGGALYNTQSLNSTFHFYKENIERMSERERLEKNTEAIKIVTDIITAEKEGKTLILSEEDKRNLSLYTGFGGIKIYRGLDLYYGTTRGEDGSKIKIENIEQLTNLEYAVKRMERMLENNTIADNLFTSGETAFYTDIDIARAINEITEKEGFKGGLMLDPSIGTARFEGTMSEDVAHATEIHGCEIEYFTAKIAQLLYPEAKIEINTFQSSDLKMGKYDLVTTNEPFGLTSVTDEEWLKHPSPIRRIASNSLHGYFTVKKIEAARNGGLINYITTRGLLDSDVNRPLREYIADNCEIIGAMRMPNTAFENTGTKVVADIILLRKFNSVEEKKMFIENPGYKEKILEPFLRKAEKEILNNKGENVKVSYNGYYEAHPEHLLGSITAGGMYSADEFSLLKNPNGKTVAEEIRETGDKIIAQRKENFGETIYTPIQQDVAIKIKEEILNNEIPYKGEYKNLKTGNLIIQDGKVGILRLHEDGYGQKTAYFQTNEVTATLDISQTKMYIRIRESLNDLLKIQLQDDKSGSDMKRAELHQAYEAYVAKYNNLYKRKSNPLKYDLSSSLVFSLEKTETLSETPDGAKKSRSKTTLIGMADIYNKDIKLAKENETLILSPAEALSACLSKYGKIKEDYLKKKIGPNWFEQLGDKVFKLPNGYETAEVYLSGDVVTKYEEALLELKDDPTYQRNVDALTKVLPKRIEFGNFPAHMGARWIPVEIYNKFLNDLFDIDINTRRYRYKKQKTGISYLESLSEYTYSWESSEFGGAAENWKSGTKSCKDIFEAALNDKDVVIYFPKHDRDEKPVVDKDATREANAKIAELKEEFERWLCGKEEMVKIVEDEYNRRFNRVVLPKWDGKHLITPNLANYTLNPHQKDALWMLLCNKGGIVDHMVGAGKTLVMQTAVMEMKRMGIARKPMLVVLKSTLSDVVQSFQAAYPTAKLLAPNENDFTPANRDKFFAQIMMNDYDCIIVTHEQLGKFDHTRESRIALYDEQAKQVEACVLMMDNQDLTDVGRKQMRQLQKKLLDLKNKITKEEAKSKENKYVFENLGIDCLFVDESHQFKNLRYFTQYSNVAGMGDPDGSERSNNLLISIRHIQQKNGGDKGVVFLSGTTISNSLTEMYNIFNYLRPQRMQEMGLTTFDAWASTFARRTTEAEFGVTTELKQRIRFRKFEALKELSTLYNEIADVRNSHNLKIDRPEGEVKFVPIKPNETIEKINQEIINMVKTSNGSFFGIHGDEKTPWGLLASNLGKSLTVSPKLIDEKYEDERGKIFHLCENVKSIYDKFTEQKGTQLIFLDTGVSKGDGRWNAYDAIIDTLANEHGIPRAEIVDIHVANTDVKRKALFKRVNEGDVRILIGGTKNMGTGVNVQKKVVAMHHMDIPWTPADVEQRNGRGIRQGNEIAKKYNNNKVDVYYYAVERTIDTYRYQLQQTKGRMINMFKTSAASIDNNSLVEGDGDDEGIQWATMMSILSGNPLVLEKKRAEDKVDMLERQYRGYIRDQAQKKNRYQESLVRRDKLSNLVMKNKSDCRIIEINGYRKNEDGEYPKIKPALIIDGVIKGIYESNAELGEILQKAAISNSRIELKQYGTRAIIKRLDIKTEDGKYQYDIKLRASSDIEYTHALSSSTTAWGQAFMTVFKKINSNGEIYNHDYEQLQRVLSTMPRGDDEWNKAEELKEARENLKNITEEYNKMADAEEDKDDKDNNLKMYVGEDMDKELGLPRLLNDKITDYTLMFAVTSGTEARGKIIKQALEDITGIPVVMYNGKNIYEVAKANGEDDEELQSIEKAKELYGDKIDSIKGFICGRDCIYINEACGSIREAVSYAIHEWQHLINRSIEDKMQNIADKFEKQTLIETLKIFNEEEIYKSKGKEILVNEIIAHSEQCYFYREDPIEKMRAKHVSEKLIDELKNLIDNEGTSYKRLLSRQNALHNGSGERSVGQDERNSIAESRKMGEKGFGPNGGSDDAIRHKTEVDKEYQMETDREFMLQEDSADKHEQTKEKVYEKVISQIRNKNGLELDIVEIDDLNVRGYAQGNKIVLNSKGIQSLETPLHEYTHIFCTYMRENEEEEWEYIKKLIKDTPYYDEVKNDEKYKDILRNDEDRIASEVIARYSGKHGAKKLLEDEKSSVFGKAARNVIKAVNRLWIWTSQKMFNTVNRPRDIADVADIVLNDLMNENKLDAYKEWKEEREKSKEYFIIGVKGASSIDKIEYTNYMSEYETVKGYTRNYKSAEETKYYTGWEQLRTGQWMKEIPLERTTFRKINKDVSEHLALDGQDYDYEGHGRYDAHYSLKDIPKIKNMYPNEDVDIELHIDRKYDGNKGLYYKKTDENKPKVVLYLKDNFYLEQGLIHELQHFAMDMEGMPLGISLREIEDKKMLVRDLVHIRDGMQPTEQEMEKAKRISLAFGLSVNGFLKLPTDVIYRRNYGEALTRASVKRTVKYRNEDRFYETSIEDDMEVSPDVIYDYKGQEKMNYYETNNNGITYGVLHDPIWDNDYEDYYYTGDVARLKKEADLALENAANGKDYVRFFMPLTSKEIRELKESKYRKLPNKTKMGIKTVPIKADQNIPLVLTFDIPLDEAKENVLKNEKNEYTIRKNVKIEGFRVASIRNANEPEMKLYSLKSLFCRQKGERFATKKAREEQIKIMVSAIEKVFPAEMRGNVKLLSHEEFEQLGTNLSTNIPAAIAVTEADGTVYIDVERARVDTPLHELGIHRLMDIARQYQIKEIENTILQYGETAPDTIKKEVANIYPDIEVNSDLFNEECAAMAFGLQQEYRIEKYLQKEEYKSWYVQLTNYVSSTLNKLKNKIFGKQYADLTPLQCLNGLSHEVIGNHLYSLVMQQKEINIGNRKKIDIETEQRAQVIGLEGMKRLALTDKYNQDAIINDGESVATTLVKYLDFASSEKAGNGNLLLMETGMHYGPFDNKPRLELMSPKFVTNEKLLNLEKKCRLSDILEKENAIFVAYPELKNIEFEGVINDKIQYEFSNIQKEYTAEYEKNSTSDINYKICVYSKTVEEFKKNIVHEIQHVIQSIEGFEEGYPFTTPLKQHEIEFLKACDSKTKTSAELKLLGETIKNEVLRTNNIRWKASGYIRKMLQLGKTKMRKQIEIFENELNNYIKNAGENEAYAVSQRIDYTREQKREKEFKKDYFMDEKLQSPSLINELLSKTKENKIEFNYFDKMRNMLSFAEQRAKVSIIEIAQHYGYRLLPKQGVRCPILEHSSGDKIGIFNPTVPAQQGYWTIGDDTNKGVLYNFVASRVAMGIIPNTLPYPESENPNFVVNKVVHDYLNIPTEIRRKNQDLQKKIENHLDATGKPLQYDTYCKDAENTEFLSRRGLSEKTIKNELFNRTFFNLNQEKMLTDKLLQKETDKDTICFPLWNAQGDMIGLERRCDEIKMFLQGSQKASGVWHSNIPETITDAVICETPLDAMSYHELKGNDTTLYFATAGNVCTEQINEINEILRSNNEKVNAEEFRFHLANDNDKAGANFNLQYIKAQIRLKKNCAVDSLPSENGYSQLMISYKEQESRDKVLDAIKQQLEIRKDTLLDNNSNAIVKIADKTESMKESILLQYKSGDMFATSAISDILIKTAPLGRTVVEKTITKDFNDDLALMNEIEKKDGVRMNYNDVKINKTLYADEIGLFLNKKKTPTKAQKRNERIAEFISKKGVRR